MHTVRANLDWLVREKKAHYLAVIKGNQPNAYRRMKALPWAGIPVADVTRDRGHGRDETRALKVATVGHLDFPHAAQALRISRWRREKNRQPSRETVYAITDLTADQVGPALADLARTHWHVENKVHYVRDVSFREDASTVRTGNAPTNLATLGRPSPTPYAAPATRSSRPADVTTPPRPPPSISTASPDDKTGQITNTPKPWTYSWPPSASKRPHDQH